MDTDRICPHCMAESMARRLDAWGGEWEYCLDCGYSREGRARQNAISEPPKCATTSDDNDLTARACLRKSA